MQTKISETIELLKEIYKTSIVEDYEKVQENIMNCILKLDKEHKGENNMTSNNNAPVKFDLHKVGKNQNEYYFYPASESEFKKEAYESGKIFVKAIHPDGETEVAVREVSKIWSTSVYSNINTMGSKYVLGKNDRRRFNEGYGIKVYACPIAYKESVPS